MRRLFRPAQVLRLFRTRNRRIYLAGKKGRTMNPLIQLKTTPPLFIILTLFCFGLSPAAQAVTPAAPDGGYPAQNTGRGRAGHCLVSPPASRKYGPWFPRRSNPHTSGNSNTATGGSVLCSATPPASKTRLMERSPFLPIPLAVGTVHSVLTHWRRTPLATETRQRPSSAR